MKFREGVEEWKSWASSEGRYLHLPVVLVAGWSCLMGQMSWEKGVCLLEW